MTEELNGLAYYATPAHMRAGVWITLEHAPEYRARVMLPTRNNRRFQLAVSMAVQRAGIPKEIDKLEPAQFARLAEIQSEMFAETCLLELELGEIKTASDLIDKFRPALEELWIKAADLAREEGAPANP